MTDKAEQFFREACRLEPDDAEAYERFGQLLAGRGAYMEAGACYENLLRLDPARGELLPQIAALYHRQIVVAGTTQ
jgi:cytochrome c-type biogenesis protein CcmH/NrfG